MKPKNELIRVVRLANSNEIALDTTGKKAGRGAYVCPTTMCLKKARKRLELGLDTKIPDEIFEQIEKDIEKNG